MYSEHCSDFKYKNEMVHNLLCAVVYLGIKMQTAHFPDLQKPESGKRIVNLFFKLLNSQFPIESPKNAIIYRTPADFATQLYVHINHLNHCLKEHTGKSTSQAINERIVIEAINLLKNTDWSITEIGDSLGFEYPQHFNTFFKKQTGKNPKYYRSAYKKNI
jgi:AraC-like DNA-binding protein